MGRPDAAGKRADAALLLRSPRAPPYAVRSPAPAVRRVSTPIATPPETSPDRPEDGGPRVPLADDVVPRPVAEQVVTPATERAPDAPRLAPDGLPMDYLPIVPFRLRSLIAEHPGLAFTVLYIGLTAIGLMYDVWYFIRFRVAILNYAETTDFLLAALREPLVVVLSLVTVPVFRLLMAWGRFSRRRWAYFRRTQAKAEASSWYMTYRSSIGPAFVFLYAILFTAWYSEWTANRVKSGRGRRVNVEFAAETSPAVAAALAAAPDSMARAAASDSALADPRPMLIGTTGRYVFLYYLRDRSTHVVPLENLGRLVITPRARERKLTR